MSSPSSSIPKLSLQDTADNPDALQERKEAQVQKRLKKVRAKEATAAVSGLPKPRPKTKRDRASNLYRLRVVNYYLLELSRSDKDAFDIKKDICAKQNIKVARLNQWIRDKSKLERAAAEARGTKRTATRTGRHVFFPNMEKLLYLYIRDVRLKGFPMRRKTVKTRALAILRSQTFRTSHPVEYALYESIGFKASPTWLTRFLHRYHLSVRRKTTCKTRLPADLQPLQQKFVQYVRQLTTLYNIPLSCIANMDETPCWFDFPSSTSIDAIGTSEVMVKTTGHERDRFTVIFAATADGKKIKPMVIFKQKTRRGIPQRDDVYCTFQHKGYCDGERMMQWIEHCWNTRPVSEADRLRYESLLIMDSFEAHLLQSVKDALNAERTLVAIVPGGATSAVQPMDVGVNRPAKTNMRDDYDEWITQENHSLTPSGLIRRAPREVAVEWVAKAWERIEVTTIRNSFTACGLVGPVGDVSTSTPEQNISLEELRQEIEQVLGEMHSTAAATVSSDAQDIAAVAQLVEEFDDAVIEGDMAAANAESDPNDIDEHFIGLDG